MILKELLDTYDNKSILGQIKILYPDQKMMGYHYALKDLRRMKTSKSDLKLRLELVPAEHFNEHPDWDTKPYIAVDGVDSTGQEWGLDFMKWSKWLASTIDTNTETEYGGLFILAHCLREMTSYGYSQAEITKLNKQLTNTTKQIKKDEADTY